MSQELGSRPVLLGQPVFPDAFAACLLNSFALMTEYLGCHRRGNLPEAALERPHFNAVLEMAKDLRFQVSPT